MKIKDRSSKFEEGLGKNVPFCSSIFDLRASNFVFGPAPALGVRIREGFQDEHHDQVLRAMKLPSHSRRSGGGNQGEIRRRFQADRRRRRRVRRPRRRRADLEQTRRRPVPGAQGDSFEDPRHDRQGEVTRRVRPRGRLRFETWTFFNGSSGSPYAGKFAIRGKPAMRWLATD